MPHSFYQSLSRIAGAGPVQPQTTRMVTACGWSYVVRSTGKAGTTMGVSITLVRESNGRESSRLIGCWSRRRRCFESQQTPSCCICGMGATRVDEEYSSWCCLGCCLVDVGSRCLTADGSCSAGSDRLVSPLMSYMRRIVSSSFIWLYHKSESL